MKNICSSIDKISFLYKFDSEMLKIFLSLFSQIKLEVAMQWNWKVQNIAFKILLVKD